ncbi:uncharacterized protein LOC128396966 isoform X2 [Panonychus citri]|uniref:uncharacterized protein LOC128396966 isoform X2 n=1 Tax=Panonychus citri TaxID=50023 RepID=UPI0023073475|nr:uncharacterized protein LOC128396966 isoform X2 [Panonychus citri]
MSNQLLSTFTTIFVLVTINSFLVDESSAATTFAYNVTVKTASTKFDEQKGNLKLSILYKDGNKNPQEEFKLTQDDVTISMSRAYNSVISSFAPLGNITSIYLRWTLAAPYNPIYLISKPAIYFDPIVLSNTFTDASTHLTINQVRKFCAPTSPVAIKHSDGASFYPCA